MTKPAAPAPMAERTVAGSAALKGELDVGFGQGGSLLVEREPGEQRFSALAVLDDGSVAATGYAQFDGSADVVLARITADGRLDPSFGEGGQVRVGTRRGFGGAIAADRAGRLLVGGYFHTRPGTDMLLARFDGRGRLDPSFGQDGIVISDFGTNDQPHAILVRADGSFVVVGHRQRLQNGAVGFRSDGSLDPGFGDGGVAAFGPRNAPGIAYVTRAVMAPDGSIVAGGYQAHEHRGVVARLTPDGRPDTRFGRSGSVVLDQPSVSSAWAVAVDSHGRALLGVHTDEGPAAIVRVLPDGTRDRSFGRDGIAIADPDGDDQFYALLLDTHERIVGVGFRGLGDSAIAWLVRFSPRGALDASFGERGIATQRLSGATFSYAADWDPSGRLVIAGDVWNGERSRALVARYH